MAKVKKNVIFLKCSICDSRNYTSYKSKNMQEKVERKKYCPKCNKHTLHVETKVK
jgi:large subunit ribosomal protein L33